MTIEQQFEVKLDVPEGWKVVAYRRPAQRETYLDVYRGRPARWDQLGSTNTDRHFILNRSDSPMLTVEIPVADAAEFVGSTLQLIHSTQVKERIAGHIGGALEPRR